MAGPGSGEWSNTVSVLTRLVSLLNCPLCKSSMEDPCVLSSCNHHFCRKCIESALCESQANCPICNIPAWIKDVQSDRQVATLIKCASSMNELTMSKPAGVDHIDCSSRTSTTLNEFKDPVNPIQRKIKSRRRSSQLCLPFMQISENYKPSLFVKGCNESGVGSRIQCHQSKPPSSANYRRPQNMASGIEKKNCITKWLQSKDSSTAVQQKHVCGISSSVCMTSKTLRRNIRGETPLHIAAIKGNVDMIEDLLQQGFNPNVRDNAGWTPLHECCNHGHFEIATLLVDHGALIDAPGLDNDTPLHDAVTNGHVDIARFLISRGANPFVRNRYGVVAKDIARTEAMRNALSVTVSLPFSPNLLISPNAIVSPSSMPIHPSNGRQIVLLGTGLKAVQKVQLEETAKQLGGTVVESYITQVTHLITTTDQSKCCPRTLKFLCAVAQGKWIVSFQWINMCRQEGHWVKEAPYEVMGIIVRDQSFITEAPRKGRESAVLQIPQLFNGCEFFFLGDFVPPHPSKQDIVRLVRMAGGTVLSREPCNNVIIFPYHAKLGSPLFTCHVIIVSSSSTQPIRRNGTTLEVPPTWIFDCLSQFQLVDTEILH